MLKKKASSIFDSMTGLTQASCLENDTFRQLSFSGALCPLQLGRTYLQEAHPPSVTAPPVWKTHPMRPPSRPSRGAAVREVPAEDSRGASRERLPSVATPRWGWDYSEGTSEARHKATPCPRAGSVSCQSPRELLRGLCKSDGIYSYNAATSNRLASFPVSPVGCPPHQNSTERACAHAATLLPGIPHCIWASALSYNCLFFPVNALPSSEKIQGKQHS